MKYVSVIIAFLGAGAYNKPNRQGCGRGDKGIIFTAAFAFIKDDAVRHGWIFPFMPFDLTGALP
jgi:hypothetical protein